MTSYRTLNQTLMYARTINRTTSYLWSTLWSTTETPRKAFLRRRKRIQDEWYQWQYEHWSDYPLTLQIWLLDINQHTLWIASQTAVRVCLHHTREQADSAFSGSGVAPPSRRESPKVRQCLYIFVWQIHITSQVLEPTIVSGTHDWLQLVKLE